MRNVASGLREIGFQRRRRRTRRKKDGIGNELNPHWGFVLIGKNLGPVHVEGLDELLLIHFSQRGCHQRVLFPYVNCHPVYICQT